MISRCSTRLSLPDFAKKSAATVRVVAVSSLLIKCWLETKAEPSSALGEPLLFLLFFSKPIEFPQVIEENRSLDLVLYRKDHLFDASGYLCDQLPDFRSGIHHDHWNEYADPPAHFLELSLASVRAFDLDRYVVCAFAVFQFDDKVDVLPVQSRILFCMDIFRYLIWVECRLLLSDNGLKGLFNQRFASAASAVSIR